MSIATTADQLIECLRAVVEADRSRLQARGVRELSLVGSRARGTATPTSDVDLLMDLAPDAAFGLLDLVALKDDLREALGVEVDIVFRSRLRPYVAERMAKNMVRLL